MNPGSVRIDGTDFMPLSCCLQKQPHRFDLFRWLFASLLMTGLVVSLEASGMDATTDLHDLKRRLILLVPINQASWALATVLALSIAGSVLGLPVTLMIALSAMLFGTIPGILYSFSGCIVGAMLAYIVGYWLDLERKLTTTKSLRPLYEKLGKGGLLTIILLRLFPLLPFTLVNLAAGAIRVRWRDYIMGTAIGMMPGIVLISFLMGRLSHVDSVVIERHADTVVILLLCVTLITWIGPLLARRFVVSVVDDSIYVPRPISCSPPP